jgi:hypothetical protein
MTTVTTKDGTEYRRRTVGPCEIKASAPRLERLRPPCMGQVCQMGKAPLPLHVDAQSEARISATVLSGAPK